MPRSKKYQEATKLVDPKKLYSITDAMALVKKTSTTKFDSSVELHVKLGINPDKSDQQLRTSVVLPHGTGKSLRIAAFVSAANEKSAKEAGADIAGGKELIQQINTSGKIDFDIAVAEPEMMKELASIAKILGPRGLMPSPKNETVTKDIKHAIEQIKKGKIDVKNDSAGNVHLVIGKVSFDDKALTANYQAALEAIIKNKPQSAKGVYVKTISLSATMGPGIKIETPL
ncbi:MAG: 50S ribosomal protein L1 [Candidatus Buchananbacteria bacterium CG10_big_fil_rev_8_21_14_0_10_42_9]|uniref:Large ribosomal subunit protein uL1 n=1 Tax=Candidatus Buchananbacteria bacterium CG10_big_fil_rev_8_21_14_0_10_42_9 TaxID=1974526 RepID=A0A2H0W4V6_9BACT|nr:MAG: 50S ribosomal protein L1 [Candidatus Buchananbacteria bacterium CG10_big_fil_rev_8_21_14_0_10_42_9]